jgi:6-phospho-3-hexuloisomerase
VNQKEFFETILEELRGILAQVEEGAVGEFIDRITRANRLFLAGTGRSGFMVRSFAVRLMHLGFTAYVAGETVTPNLEAGDLLILGSGSGETGSLQVIAQKARKLGVPIALVTASPQSTIGKLAEVVVSLPAPTPKALAAQAPPSIQPMGTLFEQSLLLLFDLIVLRLMERKGIGPKAMFARHANLE